MAKRQAEPSDEGDRALWRYVLHPLRAALQLGGGATAATGAVIALDVATPLSQETLATTFALAVVPLVAAVVKHGYPLPPIGARAALTRTAGTLALGAVVTAVLLWVIVRLGPDLGSSLGGAAVFMVAGVVIAALGRYPRIDAEGPLVTAREMALGDDALALLAALSVTAVALSVGVWRIVVGVVSGLETQHAATRILLGVVSGLAPVVIAGSFALGRRGRSPVGRAMTMVALPVIVGANVVFGDTLATATRDAANELTLDGRAAVLSMALWKSSSGWAVALLMGALAATSLAFASGLRARVHGVLHDVDDRRHRSLVLPLVLIAGLTPLLMLPPLDQHLDGLSVWFGVAVAVWGIVAVNLGAAAIGGPVSALQSRATGYVAVASVAALLAVILTVVALAVHAGGDVGSAGLGDLAGLTSVEDAQRAHMILLLFAAPVALASALVLRGRVAMAARSGARHFGWGAVMLSVAVALIATAMPTARGKLAGVWLRTAAAGFVLPTVSDDAPVCRDLRGDALVFVDATRVTQSGHEIAKVALLDDALGCTKVAAALTLRDGEIALALAPETRFARVACLLNALAAPLDGRAAVCHVRVLGADGADAIQVPRCAELSLAVGRCQAPVPPGLAYLTPDELALDSTHGGPMRWSWPAARDRLAEMRGPALGAAVRGDVAASRAVDLLHTLAMRAAPSADGADVVLLFPAVASERALRGASLPRHNTVAAHVISDDERLAAQLRAMLEGQADALERCHRDEPVDREMEYRLLIARDGTSDGVFAVPSRGYLQPPDVAGCTAQLLAGMRLSPRGAEALVRFTLRIDSAVPVATLAAAGGEAQAVLDELEAQLGAGQLDACYHAALARDARVSGNVDVSVHNGDEGPKVSALATMVWSGAEPDGANDALARCVVRALSDAATAAGWTREGARRSATLAVELRLPAALMPEELMPDEPRPDGSMAKDIDLLQPPR